MFKILRTDITGLLTLGTASDNKAHELRAVEWPGICRGHSLTAHVAPMFHFRKKGRNEYQRTKSKGLIYKKTTRLANAVWC